MGKWQRHLFHPGLPLGEDGRRVTSSKKHTELARRGAAEGMVLLKNDSNVLPLAKGAKVALFGKAIIDYVRGGGGSGFVNVAYQTNLYQGLKIKEAEGKVSVFEPLAEYYTEYVEGQYSQGHDPGMIEETEVPLNLLKKAAKFTDTAIIAISRFSGEGWDRKPSTEKDETLWIDQEKFGNRQAELFPNSDYKITAKEAKMISLVKESFKNVIVVINSGGIIETGWIKNDDKISSALFSWQGGIEGGLATADLLVGDENPSARLVDTFADELEDYPSTYNFHDSLDYVEYTDDIYVGYRYFETIPGANKKVIYPFGHGLSYTSFEKKLISFDVVGEKIIAKVKVTNTGACAGKEVVLLYYKAPNGILGKPSVELCAFVKTSKLEPKASEVVSLVTNIHLLASFDDLGKITKSAWILEAGTYEFYLGGSVRELAKLDNTYTVKENTVVEQMRALVTPSKLVERMTNDGKMEPMPLWDGKTVTTSFTRLPAKEAEGVAPCERGRDMYHLNRKEGYYLIDVVEGKCTLDQFMSQLTIDELIHLTGGQKNNGVSNTFGLGNLMEHGIPEILTTDGPAGVRILPHIGVNTTCWPCSTMLACTYNVDLAEEIGKAVALEVKENNLGIWLAPAVNIHRTPMCGRNFEYYSEDPLVAGKIGSSVVRGVQSQGIAATVKHFAFNNKETNRKRSDSRVSERAAREIYLKPFEIIVKEAKPLCIMTAYNMVNGIQTSENEELINGILRGEWKFDGLVMSDWWTNGIHSLELSAGNDLKMGNGYPKQVMEAYQKGEISKTAIYEAAKHVLELILKME